MENIEQRKIQHIQLARNPASQINKEPFSDFQLTYQALPELDFSTVDTSTKLLNKTLAQPLIIASMTGGTSHAQTINTNLAQAAETTHVAFGVGSQRIALDIKEALPSFTLVRKHAPTACIFANMGAVQLNYGKTVENYQQIVDMIEADALYLHLNPLQEALQPEGDTNFYDLLSKIEKLTTKIKVPVFVKEVGHGLSKQVIKKLVDIGISGIDVAGANGTSWAWIEGQRKGMPVLADWFKDFGFTLEESLANAYEYKKSVIIIASGGIRNPIQGLKAHLHGAHLYSAAYPFLEDALTGPENLINSIKVWEHGLKTALFVTGKSKW